MEKIVRMQLDLSTTGRLGHSAGLSPQRTRGVRTVRGKARRYETQLMCDLFLAFSWVLVSHAHSLLAAPGSRSGPSAAMIGLPGSLNRVAGGGGYASLSDRDEFSPNQPCHRGLRRAFRYPNRLSEIAITDSDGLLLALLLGGEPQVSEEADRAAVMADEIAHKSIQNVVIQLNHAIPEDNIAFVHRLTQSWEAPYVPRSSFWRLNHATSNRTCQYPRSRSGRSAEVLHGEAGIQGFNKSVFWRGQATLDRTACSRSGHAARIVHTRGPRKSHWWIPARDFPVRRCFRHGE